MIARKRILVVDDDPPALHLMKRLLEFEGFTVVSVATEVEAVSEHRRTAHPFDLLITDVVLPGEQRGYKLAWHLTEAQPGLSVLLVSAHSGARDGLDAAVEARRTAFLEKPFEPDRFLRTVRELLA